MKKKQKKKQRELVNRYINLLGWDQFEQFVLELQELRVPVCNYQNRKKNVYDLLDEIKIDIIDFFSKEKHLKKYRFILKRGKYDPYIEDRSNEEVMFSVLDMLCLYTQNYEYEDDEEKIDIIEAIQTYADVFLGLYNFFDRQTLFSNM